jgi:hypothetical protein
VPVAGTAHAAIPAATFLFLEAFRMNTSEWFGDDLAGPQVLAFDDDEVEEDGELDGEDWDDDEDWDKDEDEEEEEDDDDDDDDDDDEEEEGWEEGGSDDDELW